MKTNDPVPLVRRFSPVAASPSDSDEQQIQELFGFRSPDTWKDLDNRYRSVALAEAGAGKTFEMKARAEHVEQQGRPAFFIRIEDIEDDFQHSFDVGSAEAFEQWLRSKNDAWFYLDSVDETRLKDPRAFLITYRVPWKGTVPQRVRIPPGKLSLQPVAIGADDGGNDIVRSTSV